LPQVMIQKLIERNPDVTQEDLVDALAIRKNGDEVEPKMREIVKEVVEVLYPIAKKLIAGENLTEREQALWEGEPWSEREQALVDEYSIRGRARKAK
jgi:hypothetical protein